MPNWNARGCPLENDHEPAPTRVKNEAFYANRYKKTWLRVHKFCGHEAKLFKLKLGRLQTLLEDDLGVKLYDADRRIEPEEVAIRASRRSNCAEYLTECRTAYRVVWCGKVGMVEHVVS